MEAKVCFSPWDYDHRDNLPHLHIGGLPAEEFLHENMVVKMEYEDVAAFLEPIDREIRPDIL